MARAASFGSKNIIPLYCWKSRCVLFSMEGCVGSGGLVCHWLTFFSLFYPLKITA